MSNPEHGNATEREQLCENFRKNLLWILCPLLISDRRLLQNQALELYRGIPKPETGQSPDISQTINTFIQQETEPLLANESIEQIIKDILDLCQSFMMQLSQFDKNSTFDTFSEIFNDVIDTLRSVGLTDTSSRMLRNSKSKLAQFAAKL